MNTWRLILTPPADGAWNMAVDEAILESTSSRQALPTLRLYAWNPPCLSLGRAQPFSDVDVKALNASGWGVVRRATGGRAILHTDELTYSVAGPANHPILTGSVLESYFRLAQALAQALKSLQLPVELQAQAESGEKSSNPVCFEMPSTYEITVNGKKLIGSAQSRRNQGVLQHGTLPLTGDLTRITNALLFEHETARLQAADQLLERATTVENVLGYTVDWETAAQAFVRAFETVFHIQFEHSGLLQPEKARADEFVRDKYAHPDWTARI